MMNGLLLLLATALGAMLGYLGRRRRSDAVESTHRCHPDYFRGLDLLLNERPDDALQVFINLAEQEPRTIEPLLALGALYRRRGETEQAVRIHQGLLSRPGMGEGDRGRVLLELGRDYRAIGWLDRAEDMFRELLAHAEHAGEARLNLLEIYEQWRSWPQAVEIAETLARETGVGCWRERQAHLLAQQASDALKSADEASAERLIRQALDVEPSLPRALIVLARLARQKGDCASALALYARMEETAPEFVGLVLEDWQACVGDGDAWLVILERLTARRPSLAIAEARAQALKAQGRLAEAIGVLHAHYLARPGRAALERFLAFAVECREPGPVLATWRAQHASVPAPLAYRCEKCGLHGETLHWQCPSCRAWGSVKPVEAP